MTFDELQQVLANCDDGSSQRLSSGAQFIRHLPRRGPLAYLHFLAPPGDDISLASAEAALGQPIPSSYREFLKRANGAILFRGHLSLFGAVEHISRSPGLEKTVAVSLVFENETFPLMQRARWNEGWIRIGAVSGWSTQHTLQANRSGKCAVASKTGAVREFACLEALLGHLIGLLASLVPCDGLAEGDYGPIEAALEAMTMMPN